MLSKTDKELEKKHLEAMEGLPDNLKLEGENLNAALNSICFLREAPFTIKKLLNIFVFSTFTFVIISLIVSICLFFGFYEPPFSLSQLRMPLIPFASLIIPITRGFLRYFKKDFFKKKLVKALVLIQQKLKDPITRWLLQYLRKDFFDKALQIKEHLKTTGIDVQIIVFGHSHDPDIRPESRYIETKDNELRYFNTGTWTKVFSEEERIIREAKQFSFVRIKDEQDKPRATLNRWNDCMNKSEKLILFEPKPETDLIIQKIKDVRNLFCSIERQ